MKRRVTRKALPEKVKVFAHMLAKSRTSISQRKFFDAIVTRDYDFRHDPRRWSFS